MIEEAGRYRYYLEIGGAGVRAEDTGAITYDRATDFLRMLMLEIILDSSLELLIIPFY